MSDCQVIQKRLASLFSEELAVAVPSVDTDLISAGILDSLKFVELLVQLEQKFGVSISLDDLEVDHFRSIERIAKFLTSREGQQPRGDRSL